MLSLHFITIAVAATAFAAPHQELVSAEKPVAYWRFDDALDCCAQDAAFQHELKAAKSDVVSFAEPGPRSPKFPSFDAYNVAADFTGAGGPAFLRVKDSGPKSIFDFAAGEIFSTEAWVQCDGLRDGQNVIIVRKGNAQRASWAFQLRGARVDGAPVAQIAFAFCDEKGTAHTWTSARGFTPGEGWHHVAMTFTFGKADSAKAWINGVTVEGKWTASGAELAPLQTDDDVWIGGDDGTEPDSQFPGRIDELAIFRTPLSGEKVRARARREGAEPALKSV